jgi:REP element-mobilizing transposase RayT
MPDHFHLLLQPEPAETTPLILKGLKEETAERIVKMLRENRQHPGCRKMLVRLRLPPTVHDGSHYRLWQRRFYPFNVFSERKRQEQGSAKVRVFCAPLRPFPNSMRVHLGVPWW